MKEIDLSTDENAFEVNEGTCKECGEKMFKIVENKNLLDGTITFHIIKLKCPNCEKEYLDLDQAEKYDFSLLLEKATKQPLKSLSEKIAS